MPNIVFRFPGGRYHATPWGSHVNEGLVEWPPSPWRILRALIATGFSKLGWVEVPSEAREVVEALAPVLPTYRLPKAVAVHTRHYMPTDSPSPDSRSKVLDAVAHVGRGGEFSVIWPAELSLGATALLGELVPKLSYLGRAESVVEARLVLDADVPPGEPASATDSNRPGLEPVTLLAPISSAQYAAWRAEAAPPKPAKAGAKAGTSPFPPDLLAAITTGTDFLQKHGWSQPPGTRRVTYYRTVDSLSTTQPSQAEAPRPRGVVDTALLSLASDTRNKEVLPLMLRALPQAELLHAALLSQLGGAHCPELTGRAPDGTPLRGHQHVRILPLSLGRTGALDHFLLHAPGGLPPTAQRAIRNVRRTWTKGSKSPLFVTLAGLGQLGTFTHLAGEALPELAESRVWTSRTPFVPPRHVKARKHSLEDQVQAELESAGLPRAANIEVLGRDAVIERGFHRFVRARGEKHPQPPAPRFFAIRLTFLGPISGPIALGYGSHFGLGLMIPEQR